MNKRNFLKNIIIGTAASAIVPLSTLNAMSLVKNDDLCPEDRQTLEEIILDFHCDSRFHPYSDFRFEMKYLIFKILFPYITCGRIKEYTSNPYMITDETGGIILSATINIEFLKSKRRVSIDYIITPQTCLYYVDGRIVKGLI